MFDERRQRTTTGIDKSYPLQPITTRKSPTPASNMMKSNSVISVFPITSINLMSKIRLKPEYFNRRRSAMANKMLI